MLPVAASSAPDHRTGGGGERMTGLVDVFAVTFHFQLLQEGREERQILMVGRDAVRCMSQHIAIPDAG